MNEKTNNKLESEKNAEVNVISKFAKAKDYRVVVADDVVVKRSGTSKNNIHVDIIIGDFEHFSEAGNLKPDKSGFDMRVLKAKGEPYIINKEIQAKVVLNSDAARSLYEQLGSLLNTK